MTKKPADADQDGEFEVVHSWDLRWDRDGHVYERENGGRETRRPDLDFGTVNGDAVIDPWIQDAINDDIPDRRPDILDRKDYGLELILWAALILALLVTVLW